MGSYHLWHPCYVQSDPLTLEAFVTTGDALLDPRGGRELTAAILSAIGLAGVADRVDSVALDITRTHYFTSYRDSRHWQDRWPEAWRWRATLAPGPTPALRPPPAAGRYDLDAPGTIPRAVGPWVCLLIVDAATEELVTRARTLIESAQPEAVIERARALDRFPQVRVDLGDHPDSWFEAGAREAEDLLTALREIGASTSADSLLSGRRTGHR